MPLFLSQRDTTSKERMDDPHCDLTELQNTYRQFSTINALISRWYHVYKRELRPYLHTNQPTTLLDVGFGGGDIPVKLSRWAADDGFDLRITAIDPDPRAFEFVRRLDSNKNRNIEFLQCNLSEIDPQEPFDFIISNHLLHHLHENELHNLLSRAASMSKIAVLFNDIHRSDWAYIFFNLFSRPLFRSSFITQDGLTSIKRSYTKKELTHTVPESWKVEPLFPFRLLLKYSH